MFLHVLGVILLCSCAQASTDSYYLPGSGESLNSEDAGLFFAASGNNEARQFLTFNNTLGLVAAGLLLFGLAAAVALFFIFSNDEETGYGHSNGYHDRYHDTHSSYSEYQGRKYNPYGFNWESLNILDYISMGQEAWEKYDPTNLECQKRLICEIQQNKSKIGGPADTMAQLFGYLHYAEILSLPEELKLVLEEYMDASERGRTMQKDCGEVYEGCDFSVNGILNKFSTNKI